MTVRIVRSGPLEALARRLAELADEARKERREHPRESFEDGEAHGRFLAYRNAAAQVLNVASGGEG